MTTELVVVNIKLACSVVEAIQVLYTWRMCGIIILYTFTLHFLCHQVLVHNLCIKMDRLPPESQEQLKKMGTDRLRVNLGKAGYD